MYSCGSSANVSSVWAVIQIESKTNDLLFIQTHQKIAPLVLRADGNRHLLFQNSFAMVHSRSKQLVDVVHKSAPTELTAFVRRTLSSKTALQSSTHGLPQSKPPPAKTYRGPVQVGVEEHRNHDAKGHAVEDGVHVEVALVRGPSGRRLQITAPRMRLTSSLTLPRKQQCVQRYFICRPANYRKPSE